MKKICLKSWLMGYTLGLAGKPLPVRSGAREPVAYLYNRVRLPDISSVWTGKVDGGNAPYGLICVDDIGYYVLATTAPLICVDSQVCYRDLIFFFRWGLIDTGSTPAIWSQIETSGFSYDLSIPMDNCVWASYDILYEDDSVYLPASDPIPVYE